MNPAGQIGAEPAPKGQEFTYAVRAQGRLVSEEEFGAIVAGACFVLLLFILFVYRGLRIAYRHPEPFGQLLAAGLTLTIAIQVLINMGVVLSLLPTKGLALPFLSYGNSSMLATLASVGMLLALSRELRER